MGRMFATTRRSTTLSHSVQVVVVVAAIVATLTLLLFVAANAAANATGTLASVRASHNVVEQSSQPVYFPGRPF
jgi:hypothetical protein